MRGFDVLFKRIDDVSESMRKATMQVAQEFAVEMEAYAKRNRPWTDRHALARAHLRGKAFLQNGIVHCQIRQDLYGDTGKEYGYTLEEGHNHKYSILSPTQQHFASEFFEEVRATCLDEMAKLAKN